MTESTQPQSQINWRMLVLFFILAFALTWAVLIPALAFVPDERQMPFIILAAFGPFVAAVITIWASQGRKALGRWLRQVFRLRVPVLLYLAGTFLLPIGIGLAQYVLYRALGGEPDFSDAIPWYLYLVYLLPTALLTGGNEEPGWRGFALPALLQRFHPVLASLILGVIHAAWHLPLMGHYDTTFGWYLFDVIPLTFMLNWLYLKSRKSVLPVMLLHAGTNVISSFLPTPQDVLGGFGTYMLLRGLVYWAIAVILTIVTKGTLGWDSASTRPWRQRERRASLG
jgi:membrane protease YdiL (CAAX protease family)